MTPPSDPAGLSVRWVAPLPRGNRIGLFVAVMALTTSYAAAQPLNGPASPASPVKAPGGTDTKAATTPETLYGLVRPEDGSVLPLPPGTGYADFLEWLNVRRGPGYGINAVRISGTAAGNSSIELTAEIEVVVRHDEAVRVPLSMAEGKLLDVRHDGVGDASYLPFAPEQGHAWTLQGKGEHRLTLEMLVPLISASETSARLSLSIPADAAVTSVDLHVPPGSDVAAEEGLIRSTTDGPDGTRVVWIGTGGKVALSWGPRPVPAQPSNLSATTAIFPTVSAGKLQLRVVQRVTTAAGRLASVRMTLPEKFTVTAVTGRVVKSFAEQAGDSGRLLVVELLEPVEGTADITVLLSTTIADSRTADGANVEKEKEKRTGRIALSGFLLPGAPLEAQSGQIVIEPSSAYDLTIDAADGVRRMEMVEPGPLASAQAYEFEAQPFRVDLLVKPIPAELSVAREPMTLRIEPDRLDLDASFSVAVRRGEVQQMRLTWPAAGWNVSQIRAGPIVEFRRADGPPQSIDVSVPSGLASFKVPARGALAFAPGQDAMEVPLPQLDSITGEARVEVSPAILAIRHPAGLSMEVDPQPGLERLTDPVRLAALPAPAAGERLVAFVVEPVVTHVGIRLLTGARGAGPTAAVELREHRGRLLVEQRLDFGDAPWSAAPTLRRRLSLPSSVSAGALAFSDAAGRRLEAEALPGTDGREVVVRTEDPLVPLILLVARFSLPLPDASAGPEARVGVPFLVPTGEQLSAAEIRFQAATRGRVTGDGWSRLYSTEASGQERWVAGNPRGAVEISLPRGAPGAARISLPKLMIRSLIARDGGLRSVADCRIDGEDRTLSVTFPPGAAPEWFRWRGRVARAVIRPRGRTVVAEVELAPGAGPAVLSFAYGSTSASSLGIASAPRLEPPRFSDKLSFGQTLWRITLPDSQRLFTAPSGYEGLFDWGLEGGVWSRRLDESFIQPHAWFGEGAAALGPEFDQGHQYAFLRPSSPAPLRFSVMSRSLIVMIGAGAAIILGYAFASGLLPRRRVILVSLGAGLLLLWTLFPDQVQVFLQPALFGLALVALASAAEWILRRSQSSVPAAPSAVEFVTILPGDGSTSAPPASIGSEEPTVVRAGRPIEALSGSHHSAP